MRLGVQATMSEVKSCKMCGDCCRSLQVRMLQSPSNFDNLDDLVKFYETRGCKVHISPDDITVELLITCPHLVGNLCKIHDTKPRACKEAECMKQDVKFIGGIHNA